MAVKTAKAEHSKRIGDIEDMLICGSSYAQMVRFSSTKWGVGKRTVDKYIALATKRINRVLDVKREDHVAKGIRRYEHLYNRCLETDDLRTASDIQAKLAKLLGLNAPERTEVTGAGGSPLIPTNLTDEQLASIASAALSATGGSGATEAA